MGKDFSTMPVGFMFRKDWPWAEAFKLQELEMNENKREADSWRIRLHSPPCKALSDSHAQLGVTDMSGLFLILIFAIAYCCFSLVLENVVLWLVYHYRSSNAYWDVPQHRRSNITASSMSFETTPM